MVVFGSFQYFIVYFNLFIINKKQMMPEKSWVNLLFN